MSLKNDQKIVLRIFSCYCNDYYNHGISPGRITAVNHTVYG